MTTPPRVKNLWRNVTWKDDREKQAFYNKYFKQSKIVAKQIRGRIHTIKEKIIGYIDDNPKIKVGKTERPLNLNDVKEFIRGIQ